MFLKYWVILYILKNFTVLSSIVFMVGWYISVQPLFLEHLLCINDVVLEEIAPMGKLS